MNDNIDVRALLKGLPEHERLYRHPLNVRVGNKAYLSDRQWKAILAAYENGVTSGRIYAVLSKKIYPFYSTKSSFFAAIAIRRRKGRPLK